MSKAKVNVLSVISRKMFVFYIILKLHKNLTLYINFTTDSNICVVTINITGKMKIKLGPFFSGLILFSTGFAQQRDAKFIYNNSISQRELVCLRPISRALVGLEST